MKPTDIPFGTKKIAVIGGGISGMGAAYELAKTHDVTLFESEKRLGGHARTVLAGRDGSQPVDTGFIVFNDVNYPNMLRLFEELDVPVKNSNMNFGVSIGDGAIEYALRSLPALLAQKRNLVRPGFLRMVRDILHFNRNAFDLAAGSDMTIGQLLERLGTGAWFREYYLLPLSGAIWSTPKLGILDYPADSMLRFFKNHALLSTNNHQWKTVDGGSIEYVKRLEQAMRQRRVTLRLGEDVQAVRRSFLGNAVKTLTSDWIQFDAVVFATHADDTLRMLLDPSENEQSALGAVCYQPNNATLHADIRVMPKRSACWSSWVYSERAQARQRGISLSYWMNSLQSIPLDDPLFVTLNDEGQIDERLIYDQASFRHPVYDHATLAAQTQIKGFNGDHHRWYCGAWMANGFHEDGLASGLAVASALNAQPVALMAAE